jgi:hypothetical protein
MGIVIVTETTVTKKTEWFLIEVDDPDDQDQISKALNAEGVEPVDSCEDEDDISSEIDIADITDKTYDEIDENYATESWRQGSW